MRGSVTSERNYLAVYPSKKKPFSLSFKKKVFNSYYVRFYLFTLYVTINCLIFHPFLLPQLYAISLESNSLFVQSSTFFNLYRVVTLVSHQAHFSQSVFCVRRYRMIKKKEWQKEVEVKQNENGRISVCN